MKLKKKRQYNWDPFQDFLGQLTSFGTNNSKLSSERAIWQHWHRLSRNRRATHNEVERRRRDNINNWIMKLRQTATPHHGL